jgi:hypothetical protein
VDALLTVDQYYNIGRRLTNSSTRSEVARWQQTLKALVKATLGVLTSATIVQLQKLRAFSLLVSTPSWRSIAGRQGGN